jgi:hypothetical protein
LRESLPEYVEIARVAIGRSKPGFSASSCYGYPAAALLFSVADSIGSYYRGNLNLHQRSAPTSGNAEYDQRQRP